MLSPKFLAPLMIAIASPALGQPVKLDSPGQTALVPPAGPLAPGRSTAGAEQTPLVKPGIRVPDLAPLDPDFQQAMANSQLQTYRYNQLTEQAQALKKLCDTGFGPSDICPRPGGDSAARAADGISQPGTLPTISEIEGVSGTLIAVLSLADGRHITVHPGSILPGGMVVVSITEDDVRVSSGPGHQTALYFGGVSIR